MRRILIITIAAVLALPVTAQKARVMYNATELEWTNGPASLPKGAQMVVLEGDPAAEGVFTMRLKLPANYRISPHWHPAHERLTVIEGSYSVGHGEKFDQAALHELTTGGFSVMPAGMRHYGMSKTGATIQVHAMGPWQIIYVNPDDDPRKK